MALAGSMRKRPERAMELGVPLLPRAGLRSGCLAAVHIPSDKRAVVAAPTPAPPPTRTAPTRTPTTAPSTERPPTFPASLLPNDRLGYLRFVACLVAGGLAALVALSPDLVEHRQVPPMPQVILDGRSVSV